MKFIIMADGKGSRWNNYMGVPKHLAEYEGEPILQRTVRMLHEIAGPDTEVIITSHDPRYDIPGARRHEPENNIYEIDRFTSELVEDDICFLYGDTIYSQAALQTIAREKADDVLFFGNDKSVVAVRVADAEVFRRHFDRVRQMFIDGDIETCKGWQIYQSVTGQDLHSRPVIGEKFIRVGSNTTDINTPEEYKKL